MAEVESVKEATTENGSASEEKQAISQKSTRSVPAQQPIQLDDTSAAVCYANFCRVNGTPEELIVDFGLNTQFGSAPSQSLKVTQRVVLNYYTAKRLLAALQVSLQRHEGAFGVLETDVQKRVRPAARKDS